MQSPNRVFTCQLQFSKFAELAGLGEKVKGGCGSRTWGGGVEGGGEYGCEESSGERASEEGES